MSEPATDEQKWFVFRDPDLYQGKVYSGHVMHLFDKVAQETLCGRYAWKSMERGGRWTAVCGPCLERLDMRISAEDAGYQAGTDQAQVRMF